MNFSLSHILSLPVAALLALAAGFDVSAQNTDTLSVEQFRRKLAEVESLRKSYNFPGAMDLCTEIEDSVFPDSLSKELSEISLLSSNGENMMDFCSSPAVVAKKRFSRSDFFLHYPLKDRSWRKTPNVLDTLGGGVSSAVYYSEGDKEIFFSAPGESGARDIFVTAWRDTVWSAPELISESTTSSADEIYPMISPDGNSLYFASKGLFGMGGYDLYVSTKDPRSGDWGVPVNMGFPYSSPFDDFLFAVTEDFKYAVFASNRECGPDSDSVYVYVLEYDASPVRKRISSPSELVALSKLSPKNTSSASSSSGNPKVDSYMDLYSNVADLRERISAYSGRMEEVRSSLSSSSSDKRESLLSELRDMEQEIPLLQDSLSRSTSRLQDREMDLLSEGIVVDPIKEMRRRNSSQSVAFTFPSMKMGKDPDIRILQPEPVFDYTFKELPEGRYALDNNLPDGLVYQLQLFSQQAKAEVSKLGGLSPVFFREEPGKVVHTAGVFRTYKDALANLPKARKSFKNAFIVAFLDGKSVTVARARELEKTIHEMFLIRIYPSDGANLSAAARSAVSAVSDLDLVRVSDSGTVSYILGNFDSKEEAESTAKTLRSAGLPNVNVESAGLSSPKI